MISVILGLEVSSLVSIGYDDCVLTLKAVGETDRDSESFEGIYSAKYIEKFLKPEVADVIDIYFHKDCLLTLQYTNMALVQLRIAEVKLS